MRLDNAINDLASRQHACIAIWQLRGLGATFTEVTRLRRSRHWTPLSRRVLTRAGVSSTPLQQACAAVLEAGPEAALAAISAAALWDLGAWYQLLPASVMADHDSAMYAGDIGHVYPRRGIPDRWITAHNGMRVVRPELCIYQLCDEVRRIVQAAVLAAPATHLCVAGAAKRVG